MTNDRCTLTTKDFTIIEVMRDRCRGLDDPLRPLLDRKIASATVVFGDEIPANVATLRSRVTFRIGGGAPATRTLSQGLVTGVIGLYLPIGNLRGLALLGLAAGQRIAIPNGARTEILQLLEVNYQPEAARHIEAVRARSMSPEVRREALRVIPGGREAAPARDGHDDPGPSAA